MTLRSLTVLAALASLAPAPAVAQDVDYTQHFRVFTSEGKPASLDDIVRAMSDVDAVLVGEIHTDPVGHWIEAELVRRALASAAVGAESGALRPVAVSLEMFERDVQSIVDEYLSGLITESQFKASARPWEHYASDYRPMVEMAKEAGIPVIAANAPRRYVNRVSRLGRDALFELPPRARSVLPPLPYPPPSDVYREQWMTLMREMPMERRCEPPAAEPNAVQQPDQRVEEPPPAAAAPSHMGSFMENGLQAQALWDASMAYAITTYLATNPGALVLHMVGGFHVERFTGIPEQVKFYRPGTRSLVVSMDIAEDFRTFDPKTHGGHGDFVILTDKSLDLDYARNCAPKKAGG
ncbi:MAG: ChaN family lipoprotein [Gemmatimonadales bacterium]|nr:ChaN family lipoprotein [Gemmatimonadales bacterium]